jgi:hypothetical protein
MTLLRKIRKVLFPDCSIRMIFYSVVRECLQSPRSIFKRLNITNFSNYRVFQSVQIDCNICGNKSAVFYDFPNIEKRFEHEIGLLRETLCCNSCGATQRQRVLAHKLLNYINLMAGRAYLNIPEYVNSEFSIRIFDTDSFSPIHKILKGKNGYVSSKFLPTEKFGIKLETGIFNINLESIDFKEKQFDVVLTSDVMEHVKYDDLAHDEITRVLDNGGAYIFTVPFNSTYKFNRVLVAETGFGEVFLEKPHYHGDPLTGGILAYRIYGAELIESLKAKGLEVEFDIFNNEKAGIYQGDCFVAIKKSGVATLL